MKKVSLLLIVTITLSTVLCGCTANSSEKLEDMALNYLARNYDDTFKSLSLTDKSWAYDFAEVVFQSEKYKAPVRVRIHEDSNRKKYCVDNYYQLDMMQDAVEYFTQLSSYEVRVSFLNTVWSDELNGSATFKEWVKKGNCRLDVYYFSEVPIFVEEQNKIVQKITDKSITGTIYFFEVKESVTDKTLDEILNNQDKFVKDKNRFYIARRS